MHLTFGALPHDGGTRFRIPATVEALTLLLHDGPAAGRHPLARDGDGVYDIVIAGAAVGHRYSLITADGRAYPDPASRFQPEGVHGPSQIVDPGAFRWTDDGWRGVPARDLVVYELHVGTFSPEGTFAGVRERLPLLRELGVTAIELMPVADFPGARNWGYDGVCLYAPSRAYGRPDDLRALVDDAHRLGLGVLLDVVYNHLGPEGGYVTVLIPEYLTNRHQTPWGNAVNLDSPGSAIVREFLVANAEHWIREYHLDGLRLDATHALIDDSPEHIVREIAGAARQAARWPIHIHAEDHRNLATLLDRSSARAWGLDAVWADDFHHIVRRAVAGDSHGYYSDYTGTADELARTMRQGWLYTGQHSAHHGERRGTDASHIPMRQFVVCVENHDQIGNRARGDRLHHTIDEATWRAATTLLLTAPMIPLLFMGQEWAACSPFQFFTDLGGDLGEAVSRGRRREFAAFPEFSAAAACASIPDPQAESTFEASRLRWDERTQERHARTLALYQSLIRLRSQHAALAASDSATIDAEACGTDAVALRRIDDEAEFLIVVRLNGGGRIEVDSPRPGVVIMTTEESRLTADPAPPDVGWAQGRATFDFRRPGAVIVRTP